MIRIKNLTVKNFMSVGNVTQAIDFDRTDLTLILGENLDLGGDDSGARNGTGKTTIINALSYGLYGNALTNIKKDNLINRTNGKGMLVTIDFEKDGLDYRIERGRKPNIMKFFVGDVEKQISDESQGDSRETQADIEKLISMSHDMFQHVVALNTYTAPFLSLKANDQRIIIEQLLGITLLSEKAESLKERAKTTRDAIQTEEVRIRAVADANKRIEEQIASLKRRQTLWLAKHNEELEELSLAYDQLNQIDIDAELAAHRALDLYNQKSKDIADLNKALKQTELNLAREIKDKENIERIISSLKNHTCHSCGQEWHDENQTKQLGDKQVDLVAVEVTIEDLKKDIFNLKMALKKLGELGARPDIFYDKESDAIEHRSTLANLQLNLERKCKEQDPYAEQIEEMTKTALEEISYDKINELTKVREHEEFLLKLLTNKDSFIRKKIIDQNLSYLNTRLGYYLEKIGLPHQVEFQNDLTVSITELGRDLDFDNLSRGERNRLILSLSWAFRDVWESLYQKINLLFVDELIDSGLDASGMESSLAILKKISRDSKKSVWLVSHRDELVSRVENILKVTKSNGFTTYGNDVDG